jgi:hypothetical protein
MTTDSREGKSRSHLPLDTGRSNGFEYGNRQNDKG